MSLEDAVRAADAGMNRAAANAGDLWAEAAYRWLKRWLETHRELLPDQAWENSCPEPPTDRRAFGTVIKRAIREDLMLANGVARRKSGNLAWGPKYLSRIYVG